ncbi:ferredoxin [Nanoarchaeota archaeon NZ13-N]|uniref:Ferredoxin n=1 Tax=Candidatus Nanoclepta minutus TaxID=1940235 RepID=A0A397WM33_9ARCH|nr:MAG: ferredoxin [Nanoarchaeota archaeon NZ13-N]RIB35088.1 MAG: hypothetical protein BXU00_03325 [Candidatus Nanoclepta minutus]
MKVKVSVNKETCIACGACIAVAPEIFKWGEDGKSEPINDIIEDGELINKAKKAASVCPTNSIKVEEI